MYVNQNLHEAWKNNYNTCPAEVVFVSVHVSVKHTWQNLKGHIAFNVLFE